MDYKPKQQAFFHALFYVQYAFLTVSNDFLLFDSHCPLHPKRALIR
nr:MAG TPA: hypothetical protein [Caudoviricetes sp.]